MKVGKIGLVGLGAFVAGLAAVSASHAQPKPPAPPVATIAPVPTVSAAALLPESRLPSSAHKALPALPVAEKLKRLQGISPKAVSSSDLAAPVRLDLRAPYVDANTFLNAYGTVQYAPQFDPPEIGLYSPPGGVGGSFVRIHFPLEADRMALVDCTVRGSAPSYRTQVVVSVADVIVSQDNATSSAPTDQHLTFAVRRDSRARQVQVRIEPTVSHVYIGACEITPVR